MPDAQDWLVEYRTDGEPAYDHFADRDLAIECLRQLVGQGRVAMLYQRVPFEVKVDVTVHAPRRRRKTSPPAEKPDSDTPSGPGNGEAGEPKGAASPQAEEAINDAAVQEAAVSPVVVTVGKPTNPVSVFDCEARFEHDPVCPGPAVFDPVSKGRFCGLHAQIPEGHRREMHRLHGHRNRPLAPVARLAG